MNSSNNLHFPNEHYEKFDLDNLCDDESKIEFRFNKNDILRIPEQLHFYNRVKVHGTEA